MATHRGAHGPPRGRSAAVLAAALVAACAYAAFASGATDVGEEWRLQIGLAAAALAALAAWASGARIAIATSPAGWCALGLLAAFAAWSAITLAVSVAPDLTWASTNRAIAYALVLALAIAVGTSADRAIERVSAGILLVGLAVAAFALGGKVVPGVNVGGLFDLNHTQVFSRLRAPLGYWNALSLLCALAVPIAVRMAVDRTRGDRVRLPALAGLWLLVLVCGLTYSRGGVLALVVATIVLTALGGARLRGLVALGLAAGATLPALAVAFSRPALTGNYVPLGARISDGRLLGAVALVCLGLLLAAGWAALRLERRVRWTPGRSRLTWRALGGLAALLVLATIASAVASPGGLGGSVSDARERFTTAREAPSEQDPSRLLSTNSSNRWVWWQEAAGAWSDRPLAGWGAGSFPVTHLDFRQQPLSVRQPHSVPLQFLAETGLVGFLLAMGALGALLWAALQRVRAMASGRERDLAVALLAGGTAYLAHGFYDWDWDIPGVTVPALLMLGVLAARPGAVVARPARDAVRPLLLAGGAVALLAFAASAALPAWSDSKSAAALASLRDGSSAGELEDAAAEAELAARLNPLAVEPLIAAATIAQRRGRVLEQRRLLLRAVRRQPRSEVAWIRLAQVAFVLGDRNGVLRASRRVVELDPLNPAARDLARGAVVFRAPAASSPSAPGTPLPAARAAPAAPVAPVAPVAPAVPVAPVAPPAGG